MSANTIRWISAGLAATGGILAIGDKLTSMPGLPGWLTSSWPMVWMAAGIFDRVGHALINTPPSK